MKVKDAIAAADAVKPNAFSEETKFQWLRRLEGRLQAEVFLMAPAQIRELDLQYPADMDRELLVDPPYDDLYPLYLQARIDAKNGEYNKYRIKLEGHGGCRVYSLAREYYDGSSLKSLPGRQ